MAPSDLPIVLYRYEESPYARNIAWYLTLRKIPFSICNQPRIMPRPDIALLGIKYRRIPILSIGSDVYLDTRLMLSKLESLFPPSPAHPSLSPSTPESAALTHLLSYRIVEGGLFFASVPCFPSGMFDDAAFQKDRADLLGIDPESAAKGPLGSKTRGGQRPAARNEVRTYMHWLEEGLLAERDWVLGGSGPSVADIWAIWIPMWLRQVPGTLPAGKEECPKVWAWFERFDAAIAAREAERGPLPTLDGAEAAKLVTASALAEGTERDTVAQDDPVVQAEGLQKGMRVAVWPSDYGFTRQDRGTLVKVDEEEFVIEAQGEYGNIRLHAPRRGYKIGKETTSSKM
ncbi:glutathione S-transferase [Xylariaceae sp. FL0016]|nr:glutathione S-transferase [Xylariaceae sp. FL0016]